MRRPIGWEGFERRFAEAADPWHCRTHPFEALKRRRALVPFRGLSATALDIGCGDGAATRALAAHTLRVAGIDRAANAVSSATAYCADEPRVRLRQAAAPQGIPRGPWRRILVSELVYYLRLHEIDRLADRLAAQLAPGGRLVAVHHLVPFDDTATAPPRGAERLARRLARRLAIRERRRFGRYERLIADRPLR